MTRSNLFQPTGKWASEFLMVANRSYHFIMARTAGNQWSGWKARYEELAGRLMTNFGLPCVLYNPYG